MQKVGSGGKILHIMREVYQGGSEDQGVGEGVGRSEVEGRVIAVRKHK